MLVEGNLDNEHIEELDTWARGLIDEITAELDAG